MGTVPSDCSPLASYYNEAANYAKGRDGTKIDTITIHCYVGQVTAQQGCDYFATTDRTASCNYVVGKDGSIGVSVPESDRSYCTSNGANDRRAVTIESASDSNHPYAVTDECYNALIRLVADICKRNGIKRLVWSNNAEDRKNHRNGCNMTVHLDYANKACPGEYLYSRHGNIAASVNRLLSPSVFIESFSGSAITDHTVTTSFKLIEDYQQYNWFYKLTNLATGQTTTQAIAISKQSNSLTVNNLAAATAYKLVIVAKNSDGVEAASPVLLFSTLQDYPDPVEDLEVTLSDTTDLSTATCSLSFSQPASWGAAGTTLQKGYRVLLAVNGKPDDEHYFDDLFVPRNAGTFSSTESLSELFENTPFIRGDSLQVGILPWFLDTSGNKVFCSYPIYSAPFVIPEKASKVDRLFMARNDKFDRLAVFKLE